MKRLCAAAYFELFIDSPVPSFDNGACTTYSLKEEKIMGADPNKIRVSGENSFQRIGESEDADPTAEMSHWRVVASPKGVGHILFAKSVLSNKGAADLFRQLRTGALALGRHPGLHAGHLLG